MKPSILLITGSCGLIGRILWRDLAKAFNLYGVDICLTELVDHIFLADISNFEQVEAVFARISELEYVVHLAGDPRVDADWQSVMVNNIVGTRNIFEAAKAHGIKRVVFASSNHVTGAYEGIPPSLPNQLEPTLISVQDPIRPDGCYGVIKAAGEAIARMYYEFYGLESVCLRIGSVLKDDDPAGNVRHHSTWLSQRDLSQLLRKVSWLKSNLRFTMVFRITENGFGIFPMLWPKSNINQKMMLRYICNALKSISPTTAHRRFAPLVRCSIMQNR